MCHLSYKICHLKGSFRAPKSCPKDKTHRHRAGRLVVLGPARTSLPFESHSQDQLIMETRYYRCSVSQSETLNGASCGRLHPDLQGVLVPVQIPTVFWEYQPCCSSSLASETNIFIFTLNSSVLLVPWCALINVQCQLPLLTGLHKTGIHFSPTYLPRMLPLCHNFICFQGASCLLCQLCSYSIQAQPRNNSIDSWLFCPKLVGRTVAVEQYAL